MKCVCFRCQQDKAALICPPESCPVLPFTPFPVSAPSPLFNRGAVHNDIIILALFCPLPFVVLTGFR